MKPTVHSSEIVHQNPWYHIRQDELTWPNGIPGRYFVIVHKPSVMILAIKDNQILIIEQYRHTVGRMSIEFIAGAAEPNEDLLTAAKREFQEEGGYSAQTLECIGTFDGLNGSSSIVFNVFLATDLQQTHQSLEESEHGLRARWIPLDEWRRMIRAGEVNDGPALAAWTLYQARH